MQTIEINGKQFELEQLRKEGLMLEIAVNGKKVKLQLLSESAGETGRVWAKIGNKIFLVEMADSDTMEEDSTVVINRRQFEWKMVDFSVAEKQDYHQQEGPMSMTSPMSGRITAVKKKVGDHVDAGESVLVLEAMKMENDVAAPKQGIMKEIYVKPGSLVKAGDKLAIIE